MIGLLLCLQLSSPISQSTAFADALMRQGDYFRAISEYKRVLFYNRGDSITNYCMLQIAKAYRKSFKYESAIRYSTALLNKENISLSLRQRANLNLGISYIESNMPHLSISYLQAAVTQDSAAFPLLCIGLAELETKNWNKATDVFKTATRTIQDSVLQMQILKLSSDIENFKSYSPKSPLLASSLSFIFPGSGQLYSGHAYDAVQAFLFTASFAFATYAIYRYEHSFKEHLGLTYVGISITAIFHAANIIGANRTAHYRNWKRHHDFVKEIHDTIMRYEP